MDNWFALIVGLGSTRCFMDIEQLAHQGESRILNLHIVYSLPNVLNYLNDLRWYSFKCTCFEKIIMKINQTLTPFSSSNS